MKAELDEVKKTYYAQLHRFSVDVVSKKYSDLKRRLYPSLEGLFNLYCQKIQIKAEKIFDLDLKSNDRTISSSTLSSAKSRSLVFYRASLEGKHLLFAFLTYVLEFIALDYDLPHEEKMSVFQDFLSTKSDGLVHDFLSKYEKTLLKELKSKSRDFVAEVFSGNNSTWFLSLESKYLTEFDKSMCDFKDKTTSLSEYAAVSETRKHLKDEASSLYRDILLDEFGKSMISVRAMRVFENLFRYDEAGRPRLWNGNSHIDEIYDSALKKVSHCCLSRCIFIVLGGLFC